jgi:hypothetical protein
MVTARAEARWAAMVKGDLDTAYGYMSPASRQVTSLDKYKGIPARRVPRGEDRQRGMRGRRV